MSWIILLFVAGQCFVNFCGDGVFSSSFSQYSKKSFSYPINKSATVNSDLSFLIYCSQVRTQDFHWRPLETRVCYVKSKRSSGVKNSPHIGSYVALQILAPRATALFDHPFIHHWYYGNSTMMKKIAILLKSRRIWSIVRATKGYFFLKGSRHLNIGDQMTIGEQA